MSVLPSSATFPTFFAVLAILFLVTILVGAYLSTIALSLHHSIAVPFHQFITPPLRNFFGSGNQFVKEIALIKTLDDIPHLFNILSILEDIEAPTVAHHPWIWSFLNSIYQVFVAFPSAIVRKLWRELLLPRDLWIAFRLRDNKFVEFRWTPLLCVVDIFRLVLLPIWLVVIVIVVGYLLVLKLCIEVSRLFRRSVCCR